MHPRGRHREYTIEEYVLHEEYANVKHEFLDGQIYLMAGGSPEHSSMAMRVGIALGVQLRGRRCSVYNSDARVRVVATGLDTYPDVSVACGAEERDVEDRFALTNPVVLVEVLSPSTEAYDRGEKVDHYKRIVSLREIVLVSHGEALIEVIRRGEEDDWTHQAFVAGQIAELRSIDCTLDVDEVYSDPLTRPAV
jgi:Uma2 family endonuclease